MHKARRHGLKKKSELNVCSLTGPSFSWFKKKRRGKFKVLVKGKGIYDSLKSNFHCSGRIKNTKEVSLGHCLLENCQC